MNPTLEKIAYEKGKLNGFSFIILFTFFFYFKICFKRVEGRAHNMPKTGAW